MYACAHMNEYENTLRVQRVGHIVKRVRAVPIFPSRVSHSFALFWAASVPIYYFCASRLEPHTSLCDLWHYVVDPTTFFL